MKTINCCTFGCSVSYVFIVKWECSDTLKFYVDMFIECMCTKRIDSNYKMAARNYLHYDYKHFN